MRRGRA
ncbi:hypothetical protein YPPY64_2691, partial [Yersinia pestis PY-64]